MVWVVGGKRDLRKIPGGCCRGFVVGRGGNGMKNSALSERNRRSFLVGGLK